MHSQASGEDPYLKDWKKCGTGIEIPPPELGPAHKLVGWRDPFIFKQTKTGGDEMDYEMLLGSGFKGEGGTALIYKSNSVLSGWKFDRFLCKASSTRTGAMWECPLLADLSSTGAEDHRDHFFCISPDAPTKKVLYWLGEYKDGAFMLEDAIGPFVLDLGVRKIESLYESLIWLLDGGVNNLLMCSRIFYMPPIFLWILMEGL